MTSHSLTATNPKISLPPLLLTQNRAHWCCSARRWVLCYFSSGGGRDACRIHEFRRDGCCLLSCSNQCYFNPLSKLSGDCCFEIAQPTSQRNFCTKSHLFSL